MATESLQGLLRHFPPSAYSFAYGSAVFRQKNQPIGKMVDLIFVVDNPVKWHTENIARNPRHYSFLKYFGSARVTEIQESWAAGVYYNTLVKVDDRMIKYGVVSSHALIDDLKNWTHAYISGRLHKPVLELSPPTNSHIVRCIKQNRLSALRTVLLQLPTQSRKWDLYHGITELSYFGDSRMRFGEHPNKVSNILAGNVEHFDEIYQPLIQELNPLVEGWQTMDIIVHDTSSKARLHHLLHLPFYLQRCICRECGRDPALHDVEEVLVEISSMPSIGEVVRRALGNIVRKSSVRQTAQGILTAGPFKAIRYGLEKIGKKISGSRESKASLSISNPSPRLIASEELPKEPQKVKEPEQKFSSRTPSNVPSPSPIASSVPEPVSSADSSSSSSSPVQPVEAPHAPNLSDLDFPFPLKRSAQENEQENVRQALITVKVKGEEAGAPKTKAPNGTPSPIFSTEELKKSVPKSTGKLPSQDSTTAKSNQSRSSTAPNPSTKSSTTKSSSPPPPAKKAAKRGNSI